MLKYLLLVPFLLTATGASGQVMRNKSGAGFNEVATYRMLQVGPLRNAKSRRAGNGRTGVSDVPVFSARAQGVRIRRLTQEKASGVAIRLSTPGGYAMGGVAVFAGDVMGSLRIVRYGKHVFGVVDGLRKPYRGAGQNQVELGRSLTDQVTRRTGCAINGPPLMMIGPGHLNKLSIPLACN